jgi:hypothetical protein
LVLLCCEFVGLFAFDGSQHDWLIDVAVLAWILIFCFGGYEWPKADLKLESSYKQRHRELLRSFPARCGPLIFLSAITNALGGFMNSWSIVPVLFFPASVLALFGFYVCACSGMLMTSRGRVIRREYEPLQYLFGFVVQFAAYIVFSVASFFG